MLPADLLESFSGRLQAANRVYVGFSGGLDSTLLLHGAAQLLGSEKVCALHANHQLQAESDCWQEHCLAQAKNLGVEFRHTRLEVKNQGKGIENQARELRYEFFQQQLQPGDLLLLGHQMDDQAETLLYRLVRGTGLRGLSAIPSERPLSGALLLRPLLDHSRETLFRVATEQHLLWIEDPSNQDDGYDRNYLRHRVLPVIQERWPAAKSTLARSANNLGASLELLDEYGDILLANCDWRPANWGKSFDLTSFARLSDAAQVHLLNTAFRQMQLQGFDAGYREKVIALVQSGEDKTPLLRIGNSELRRYMQRLYLMPAIGDIQTPGQAFSWTGCEALEIPGCGTLYAIPDYQNGDLQVRLRQGGERCKPLSRDKSQSLKKVLQECKLEPWLRDRIPLVYRDGEIAAVAGLFSCVTDIAAPKMEWQPR